MQKRVLFQVERRKGMISMTCELDVTRQDFFTDKKSDIKFRQTARAFWENKTFFLSSFFQGCFTSGQKFPDLIKLSL